MAGADWERLLRDTPVANDITASWTRPPVVTDFPRDKDQTHNGNRVAE